MSIFSSYKKIFLLGFIIVILLAIPLSVYVAQERQQTKSKAAASTILSFEPASPTVKVGEKLVLSIMLNPGTGTDANQVSFVKLSISFDASKFTTISGSLKANPEPSNALTTEVDAPKYESGKATLSLSIGANPEKAITTKTKIAIFELIATNTTAPTIPNITFDPAPETQVLSIDNNSQTSDNVLSSATHATATVTSAAITAATTGVTPTSSPNLTTTPTRPSSSASTSTIPRTGGLPSSSFPSSSSLTAPICSSLEVNGPANGIAPYPLTFTVTGNDSDGSINKISFNFGDSVEDLTAGGGIGTASVSSQILHTYRTPGIYYAYTILTDNDNNLSAQQDVCTKTITINSSDSIQPTIIVNQSLPPTGNGEILFGLGALGIIFTIIGGALLLL